MNRMNIQQIRPYTGQIQQQRSESTTAAAGAFQDLLEKSLAQSSAAGITFSSHAADRLRFRNITLSSRDISRLTDSVNRAKEKGSRDSLVLMDSLAFVVSVKNKMIVTAMTRDQMQDKVITNIDSTVIA